MLAPAPGTVLAAAAHPDDIEFMMAGTLFLLRQSGWDVHYLNIANGSCGSASLSRDEIVAMRTREAREACALLGATFHEPLVDDLEIVYDTRLAARLCAVVRMVKPSILLLQSPQDYMEDHVNSVRLMVTAAFCRGMPNYPTNPPVPVWTGDMAVYHALPYGLLDSLRRRVAPEFVIDIGSVMEQKKAMLSCHASQRDWLDASQGLGSYVATMEGMAADVGAMSGVFAFAEGWRRHLHLGFGPAEYDPLAVALSERIWENPGYRRNQDG